MKNRWILPLIMLSLFSFGGISQSQVQAEKQVYLPHELILLNKENVAKGNGTLEGQFSFTRDLPPEFAAIREIGWMTLRKGASVGLHKHKDNEDAYLIVSGEGIFSYGDGNEVIVKPGDITIARPSQGHGLRNEKDEPLVFLDIIAINKKADIPALMERMEIEPDHHVLQQIHKKENLIHAERKNVAGGKGILSGDFGFTRNMAWEDIAIKEIGWMTLEKGASIGLHGHTNNEDTYIIISGHGIFTDSDGKETVVGPGAITIARPGEKHGLRNERKEPLIFLDVIAQNHALKQ